MTTDERIGRALATIADDLRPEPDPYGRVLARRRRSARRRTGAVVVAVLVIALGVTASAMTWTRTVTPPAQNDPDREFSAVNAWAAKLANGPTHGAVGTDGAFVAEISAGIMRNWREGRYAAERLSVDRVTVPFLDDVGPYRIALAVLVLTKPDERNWPHASVWLYGARGASAATLVAGAERVGHGLEPYAHTAYAVEGGPTVNVAVVPPQCRFATTTTPADPRWTPEPTGSYIVRTGSTTQPEWWQVDCGGDVRAELPSPARRPAEPTEAEIDQALATARVQVDRSIARQCVLAAAQPLALTPVAGTPALVWVGDFAGSPAAVAGALPPMDRAAVAVARLDKGGWAVILLGGWSSGSYGWVPVQVFTADGDPIRPDATFVLRPREDDPDHLVIPPAGATSVRALYRGAPVGAAAVTAGAARLSVPVPFDTVEALGPGGAVLGRGAPAEPLADTGIIDRWSQP
ncbi:hypothetical protein [Virgisporangium aurantiacum]|uniref:Uncharacterized protein n=1 Tax=Virgisporangium aurantiacum TaxID=175570 RepID=A0A8J4E2J0_9ACTN|nr:hypothetical protein [Virgisporangium aurantiacum]GIJ59034.1 hypothetical protein Vau01_065500 [Virgisporangium aurantiacum]